MTNCLQQFFFSHNCLDRMIIVDKVFHKFLLLINFLQLSEGCKRKGQQSQEDHGTFSVVENITSFSTFWIQSYSYPKFSPDSVSANLRFFPLKVANFQHFYYQVDRCF